MGSRANVTSHTVDKKYSKLQDKNKKLLSENSSLKCKSQTQENRIQSLEIQLRESNEKRRGL